MNITERCRAIGKQAGFDPVERAKRAFFREGISSSRIYFQEGRESVGAVVIEVLTGLKSAFTYTGARTCEEFYEKVVVGVQTHSGFKEGTPHGEVRD